VALNPDSGDRMARLTISGTVEAGSNVVALTAQPTDYAVGDFAILHTANTASALVPQFLQINQVISVDLAGQKLFFAKPFKRRYTAGFVSRFGTGKDQPSGFGDTPWLCVGNISVSDLSMRSTGRLFARNATWNFRMTDVDLDGGSGIGHNALVYSELRRLRIRTKERGIESKIGSFALLVEDVDVIFESSTKNGRVPLVANGESAEDIIYRRLNVYDGPNFGQQSGDTDAMAARLRIGAYDTRLEACTVVCSIAGANAAHVTTGQGGERTRAAALRLVVLPASLDAPFLKIDAAAGQAGPSVGIDGLVCVGTSGSPEPVRVDAAAGDSYIRDLQGATLGGDEANKVRQYGGLAGPDVQLHRPDNATLGVPGGVSLTLPATYTRPALFGPVRVWRDGNQTLRLRANADPESIDDGDAFPGGHADAYIGTGTPAPAIDMQGLTAITLESASTAEVSSIVNTPANRPFTLLFTNNKVTIVDGTLKLAGSFTGTANSVLTMIRIGTIIYEIARSANG